MMTYLNLQVMMERRLMKFQPIPPQKPKRKVNVRSSRKEDNVNKHEHVNAADTYEVNAAGGKTSIELQDDPDMPELEDYSIFEDAEDDGAEAEHEHMGCIYASTCISSF
ncbi:hypothetical protein Tco_0865976 [Tanacetum coccineum]